MAESVRLLRGAAKRAVRKGLPFLGSVTAVKTVRRELVLTYDDGPVPGTTAEISQSLAENGCTATFFVLLSRTRTQPELVHELLAAGHEIALHGQDHRRLTDLAPAQLARWVGDGKAELEDLIQRPVRWYRPPYGAQNLRVWRAIGRAGMHSVLWSASVKDTVDVPESQRVSAATQVPPGTIVLAHDNRADHFDGVDDGPGPLLDRVALCRRVVVAAAERDLRVVSLGEALEHGTPVREAVFAR